MEHKSLMRDRRFWPIFWTQFFGAFNDNVFKNALVILIAYKAYNLMGLGADQMVALCGGIFILPFFLFSALAGQISDKFPKHKLILFIKLWEVGVMILGAFGFAFENVPTLLFSLFLMGLQSAFFGPVKYSVLPELIEDEELTKGNALIEMGTFLSILLGTILGGILIGIKGEVGAYFIGAATLIFAGVGTFFSAKVQKLKSTAPELKIKWGILGPTLETLRITKEVKSVFLSILAISWFWFLGAALLSIFPVYVKDVLHGNEQLVTLFLAMFSIGVAVGSIVCEKLSKERVELGLVPIGSFGITIFILDLYFLGHPIFDIQSTFIGIGQFLELGVSYRILFDLFFISVFSGIFIVPLYTFIQQRSPSAVRSRVIAGNNILNALFMVLSAVSLTAAYGLVATVIDVLLGLAILNAIVAIYIYTVIPEFLLRLVCFALTRSIYRLKVKGHKNIPNDGAAILTCNHVSFIDWLIVAAGVKRPVRFVMHYSFMKMPFVSFLLKGAKVIPIAGAKEDPAILEKAFDSISQALSDGELVCIFPEGKITHDGSLNPFRAGVEKILQRDPVPVVPMVLKGIWGSFFSRKWNGKALSRPSVIKENIWKRIELIIEEPISSESANSSSLEEKTLLMLGEESNSTESKKVS